MSCFDSFLEAFLKDLNIPKEDRDEIIAKSDVAIETYQNETASLSLAAIAEDYYTCTASKVNTSISNILSIIFICIIMICLFTLIIAIFVSACIRDNDMDHRILYIILLVFIYVIILAVIFYLTYTGVISSFTELESGLKVCIQNAQAALVNYTDTQKQALNDAFCAYANA